MILNLNFDLICCINRFIVVWFGKEDCSRGICFKDLDLLVVSIKLNFIVIVV